MNLLFVMLGALNIKVEGFLLAGGAWWLTHSIAILGSYKWKKNCQQVN